MIYIAPNTKPNSLSHKNQRYVLDPSVNNKATKCVSVRWNWNLEVLVFEKRGKPECTVPGEKLFGAGREPTTNSTHTIQRNRRNRTRVTIQMSCLLLHGSTKVAVFFGQLRQNVRRQLPYFLRMDANLNP